jgi:hypothetical protein
MMPMLLLDVRPAGPTTGGFAVALSLIIVVLLLASAIIAGVFLFVALRKRGTKPIQGEQTSELG